MHHLKKLAELILPRPILERLGFYVFRKQLFDGGTWPLFRAKSTLRKSAKNPDTFNKKIKYKMAHDRRDLLSIFADKVAVRKYVSDRIGDEYLTLLYGVSDRDGLENLPFENLPRNFVMKANHGSGAVIIVSEHAEKSARLPDKRSEDFGWERFLVHPDNLDWTSIRLILKKWLSLNYYYTPGNLPEWAYKNIKPKIIFEELLVAPSGVPDDYRFFTFDGRCDFIQVDTPVYGGAGVTRDIFTRDWNRLNVTLKYPNSKEIRPRPINLEKMIEISEKLGAGVDHVRIDLYDLSGRIVFGEMTNYHAAGQQKFVPESFDYDFGNSWHPENFY